MSVDIADEHTNNPWYGLFSDLSHSNLEKLEEYFKENVDEDGEFIGLGKEEFVQKINGLFEFQHYSLEASFLFDEISENVKQRITWNEFLDFLIASVYPVTKNRLELTLASMDTVPHTKIESVAKIVILETEQYFCYAIILKHGRVGLYDGNLNFLTSYHCIMTREDISRPEDERRRRNRWITDAIFCPDCLMFIITNTSRSIMIYEASGLKHIPYWLILSTPNILECLTYKPFKKLGPTSYSESVLYSGDCSGQVMSFTFLQPKNELLRRKRTDNITLFYWRDFIKETDHVLVKNHGKVHENSVKHIQFYPALNLLLTCSKDATASVVFKWTKGKKKTIYYKVPRGVSCFAMSPSAKILITGSDNGIIRIWNTFINKSIATLTDYVTEIMDVQIIDSKELFISCSSDGIFKLWDLQKHVCLQTIRLKFPSFKIHGKEIEWGINCIFPGPRRKQPDERKDEGKKECFGVKDINEVKLDHESAELRVSPNVWERSCILVTCCNYLAILRTNFAEASIEYGFSFPILPPPPLQNSVLIPINWGLQSESYEPKCNFENQLQANVTKQLHELRFILGRNILEEEGRKSDINFKIAILESKKAQMRSKVSLGSPYLALDLHEIPDLKLSEDLKIHNKSKTEFYMRKINQLLSNAAHQDAVFSTPEADSSRSKSSRSSVVELPY